MLGLALAAVPGVQAQQVVWTRQFGSEAYDAAGGISVDASGVYAAGLTLGTLPGQTSSGSHDVFVRKYDAAGTELWTRQFGSAGSDYSNGNTISVDASGVYVAGQTNGALPGHTHLGDWDAFVRKYDAAGTELWTRQFGTSIEDAVNGISVGASGVYVAGHTDAALPGQTYAGGHDAFVRKYDTAGTELWTRQFGSASNDGALGVSVDASGVYVVGGAYGALPGQTYAGDRDVFVRKYDAAGTELWTRQFGLAGIDQVYGVSADASGVHMVGIITGALPGQTDTGGQDAFVRKYDAAGNEVWTHQFGTAGNDGALGVSVDASGIYAAGGTGGALPGQTSSGDSDAFVVKLVSLSPPTVALFAPFYDGLCVSINGVAFPTEPGASIVGIFWTWGDGASTPGGFPQAHTYSFIDTFDVEVTATDTNGATGSASVSVTPTNAPNTVAPILSISPATVSALSVSINGFTDANTCGPQAMTLSWSWGDGTTTQSFFPGIHTYSAAGSYNVCATTMDSRGLSTTQCETVIITNVLGFYHPVDMGGVLNTVKNGATVPLKFEVFEGATELTDTSVVQSLSSTQVACDTGLPTDGIEITATGGTSLRYDTTAGQFVYNWKTPKMGNTCWDVTLTVVGGSSITAHFKLR